MCGGAPVCVGPYACMYMHMRTGGQPRAALTPQELSTFLSETMLSTAWGSPIRLGWLTSKLQGPLLCLSSAGITSRHHDSQLLTWVLETEHAYVANTLLTEPFVSPKVIKVILLVCGGGICAHKCKCPEARGVWSPWRSSYRRT